MTAYFSYIGALEGGDFQWDTPPESTSASNLPPRLVPANPLYDIGVGVLWVMQQAGEGRHDGRQLDWGAWGLNMTGAELRAMFGDTHAYADELAVLDADTAYVLVAGELW